MRFQFSAKYRRGCVAALLLGLIALAHPTWALAVPPLPAPAVKHPIAIVGGTIHLPQGEPLEGGTVLFQHGKLTAVGKDVKLPAGTQQVDATGKHVYPGLCDAFTELGLSEIEAVRATNDFQEVGLLNPNVQAQIAVNPDSELLPVARANGITYVLTVPRGRFVQGTSALLQLDGWTTDDLTLAAPVGMHVRWPVLTLRNDPREFASLAQQRKTRDERIEKLRDLFADARTYLQAQAAAQKEKLPLPPHDIRLEAMRPILNKSIPLIVSADEADQIQDAVTFAQREQVRLVIHGGYEAERCAHLLTKYQVPVLLAGVHRLPRLADDPYDAPFTLANRLRKAGVQFAITSSDAPANVRNLPYHAAQAAAYGLPAEEAIRAITLYPAQILGLSERIGSLAVGRDATLIVTTGDPLDLRTEVVEEYIGGRKVDLNNRHRELYERYREKYRRLGTP